MINKVVEMNVKPVISIVIPAYNSEKTIGRAIESVLNQTFKQYEVIIINDGSFDKTVEVVFKYSSEYSCIKLITQNNNGVSVARNRGINEATGRYICFLDSDDYYETTFLEKMYKTIADTGSEVCYCGFYYVSPAQKAKRITRFIEGSILKFYILNTVHIHTASWMIKKDLISLYNITFPEGVSWGEDIEFFCEMLSVTKKVCFVKEYLTNYTIDFEDDRLSAFSIDKIDKDYQSIRRILDNIRINKSLNISKALIDYRLSALITYGLLSAFKYNVDNETIKDYFNRYKNYIVKFTFNNGLRSIKLSIKKIKLLYLINKLN